MAPRFLLQTFGGLAMFTRDGGEPVLVNQRKRLAFIAALAADANGGMARERLVALFWPESNAERARNALNQLVFAIRRDLGEAIQTDGVSIRLDTDVVGNDVRAFRDALANNRFADAVAEYRGPFLDGVYLRDAAEFERWTDDVRRALAADYARALEREIDAAMGAAPPRVTDALRYARLLAAHDPLSTQVALRLIRALERSGDTSAALRHASTHATRVRAELGSEPGTELERELTRLRAKRSAEIPPVPGAAEAPRHAEPHSGVPSTGAASSRGTAKRRWGVRGGVVAGLGIAALGIAALTSRRTTDPVFGPWAVGRSHVVGPTAFYEFTLGLRAVAAYGPGAFRERTVGDESIKERGVSVAIDHFRRALALDSQFVEAKLWLIDQADIAGDHHSLVDSAIASAQRQSTHVVLYDRLSIERQIAWVSGDNEGAYSRAKQMLSLEPNAPDAQLAMLQAAIAVRRYSQALSLVRTLRHRPTWLAPRQPVDSVLWTGRLPSPYDTAEIRRFETYAPNMGGQLWRWEMELHHVRGEFDQALAVWREVALEYPNDAHVCEMGIPQYAAKGSSAQVDSLVTACALLANGSPLIPLRAYADIALPEYIAHGYRDQAVRALAHVSARFEELKGTQRAKARFLGMYQAALGDWRPAYDNIRAGIDTTILTWHVYLAVAAAHLGDSSTVRESMRWIDTWASHRYARGRDEMAEAFIALATGDTVLALGGLRKSMWRGVSPLHMDWYHELALEPLRNDPRLIALIREQR